MTARVSKRAAAVCALLAALAAPAAAIPIVIPITDAAAAATILANIIIGPGVTLFGTPTYIGNILGQAGTFSGGGIDVGFESGIILTSGSATQIPGANPDTAIEVLGDEFSGSDSWNNNINLPGDADLSALVSGANTFDANVLEFQFLLEEEGIWDLRFDYVFASEEYINFVGSQFNDVLGFFLNGTNIGIVTVNSINPASNAALYRNNVPSDPDTGPYTNLNLGITPDGLTAVLTAEALGLSPGVHTMKIAVADTADRNLDSAVFIREGSFTAINVIPEPGTMALLGSGLIALGLMRRRKK